MVENKTIEHKIATPANVPAAVASAVGKYLREGETIEDVFDSVKYKFKSHHVLSRNKFKAGGKAKNFVVTEYKGEEAPARALLLRRNYKPIKAHNNGGTRKVSILSGEAQGALKMAINYGGTSMAIGYAEIAFSPSWIFDNMVDLGRMRGDEKGFLAKRGKEAQERGGNLKERFVSYVRTPFVWLEAKDIELKGHRIRMNVALVDQETKAEQGATSVEDVAASMGLGKSKSSGKEIRAFQYTLTLKSKRAQELYSLLNKGLLRV